MQLRRFARFARLDITKSPPLSLERGVHVLIESTSAMANAKAIALGGVEGIGMDGHEERCGLQEQKGCVTKTILITVYSSIGKAIDRAIRGYS